MGCRWDVAVLIAALCWSTSGVFAHTIGLSAGTMACSRAWFAALAFLPFLRGRPPRGRGAVAALSGSFAIMSVLFLGAMVGAGSTRGTSTAATVFLQYTSLLWVCLGSVYWLREPMGRADVVATAFALAGIAVIVAGTPSGEWVAVVMALGAGVAFAGVVLSLRRLRGEDPCWLLAITFFVTGLALVPAHWLWPSVGPDAISLRQWLLLAGFGVVQMALPYFLFTAAVARIGAARANLVALVEPVLNPVWAWLATGETAPLATWGGGALILCGLAVQLGGAPAAPAGLRPRSEAAS